MEEKIKRQSFYVAIHKISRDFFTCFVEGQKRAWVHLKVLTVSLCFVRNLEHQSAGASTYEATGTRTNEQLRESSRTEVYYCTVPQSDFGTVRLYEYTVPFLLRHTIKVETYLLEYVCSILLVCSTVSDDRLRERVP